MKKKEPKLPTLDQQLSAAQLVLRDGAPTMSMAVALARDLLNAKLVPLDKERAEGIVSIIGESVHTAMRKCIDSPQSAVAWKAIRDLPGDEWSICCELATAQVIRYLSRGNPDPPPVVTLDPKLKPLLKKWDGMEW